MLTDDRRAPGWSIRKRVGTDYLLTITPTDPATGNPVVASSVSAPVLVSGAAVGALIAAVDPVTGVVTVELSAAQSTALGQITGVWELLAVVGGEVQQWLTGPIRLSAAGSPRDSRPRETADLSVGSQVNINLSVIGAGSAPLPPFAGLSRISDPVKSSVFMENNGVPTPVLLGVPAKVEGVFLAGPPCQSCTYNGNRITYIATPPTRVMALASVDIDGPNNVTFRVELRRNGLPVDGAAVQVRRGVAIANGTLNAMIPLVTGDFVELWITNVTNSSNPTVVDATIALMN